MAGKEAGESVGKEMKQLHWQNSFKPKHWKFLTAEQCKKMLESYIFIERKRDGILKAQQVAGGNKQQGYFTKEDASSLTVSLEAVLLMCKVDANKNRDVATVDIPNAFVQTIVEDEKDMALICIRGPLVDILVSIALLCYGWQEGQETNPCLMFDCFIWHNDGTATILQEVSQEFEVQGI